MPSSADTVADEVRRLHDRVLRDFAANLKHDGNLIAQDSVALRQCVQHASTILEEFATRLGSGPASAPPRAGGIAVQIGETRAATLRSPNISFNAAATLFETVMTALGRLPLDPVTTVRASVVLNHTINERVGIALASYSRYLLDNIHRAHVTERFRIGRELHDRIGNDVGAALQLARLARIYTGTTGSRAQRRDATQRATTALGDAADSLTHAVDDIRAMTTQLRSLVGGRPMADALAECRDGLGRTVPVTIEVGGAERLMPDYVQEELFVVMREAMRNAVQHARAAHVRLTMSVGPTEVVATVVDDGVGFDTTLPRMVGHTGLVSMAERVQLLGGDLQVHSAVGTGTSIELRVPLLGLSP